jgi:hypothetical protein
MARDVFELKLMDGIFELDLFRRKRRKKKKPKVKKPRRRK